MIVFLRGHAKRSNFAFSPASSLNSSSFLSCRQLPSPPTFNSNETGLSRPLGPNSEKKSQRAAIKTPVAYQSSFGVVEAWPTLFLFSFFLKDKSWGTFIASRLSNKMQAEKCWRKQLEIKRGGRKFWVRWRTIQNLAGAPLDWSLFNGFLGMYLLTF